MYFCKKSLLALSWSPAILNPLMKLHKSTENRAEITIQEVSEEVHSQHYELQGFFSIYIITFMFSHSFLPYYIHSVKQNSKS